MDYFYDGRVKLTDARVVKKEGGAVLEVIIKDGYGNIITIPRISLDTAQFQITSSTGCWDECREGAFILDVRDHPTEGMYSLKKKTKRMTKEEIEEKLGYPIEIVKE